jgi:SAM-dependent methyltransferase
MSLTPEVLAVELGKRAAGRSVVDAMCGCGGNAIGFARAGCSVTSLEIDARRLEMARHNARIYGVDIDFRQGNAAALIGQIEADILFVDPPWGADWNRHRTGADDLIGLTTVSGKGAFEETWIKVPPSFDVGEIGGSAEAWFGEAEGDRRRVKFVIVRA